MEKGNTMCILLENMLCTNIVYLLFCCVIYVLTESDESTLFDLPLNDMLSFATTWLFSLEEESWVQSLGTDLADCDDDMTTIVLSNKLYFNGRWIRFTMRSEDLLWDNAFAKHSN